MLVEEMRDEAVRIGAKFYLVTLSTEIQVSPIIAEQKKLQARLGVSELFYAERRLGEFAQRHGIPALTLAPELARIVERDGKFFHGFEKTSLGTGHWNEEGHQKAAGLLASWLAPRLFP